MVGTTEIVDPTVPITLPPALVPAERRDEMAYYLKAAAIIIRHPVNVLRHPSAGYILSHIAKRQFRLHWLRDVAREPREWGVGRLVCAVACRHRIPVE